MIDSSIFPLLSKIDSPEDLRRLPADQIGSVAEELRRLGYRVEECLERGACVSRFWGAGEGKKG